MYSRYTEVRGRFQSGEDGWNGFGYWGGLGEILEFAEEVITDVVRGAGFGRNGVFGGRCNEAEGFVVDDLFDELGTCGFLVGFSAARQQVGRDLEAVEKHLGGAEVE